MKKEKNRKVKKGAGGRKHSWQYRAISLMCVILLVCSTVILDTGLSRANSFDDEISLDTENVDTVENAAETGSTEEYPQEISQDSSEVNVDFEDDFTDTPAETVQEENLEAAEEAADFSAGDDEETVQPETVTYTKLINNDTVEVKAEAEAGTLPEGAELNVTPVEKETEQYTAVENVLTSLAQNKETKLDGFLTYNVSFTDSEGNPVEPNRTVQYSFQYTEPVSPELADPENTTVTAVKIRKNTETSEMEFIELNAEDHKLAFEMNESRQLQKAEFQSADTATVAFAWNSKETAQAEDNNGENQNQESQPDETPDQNTEQIPEQAPIGTIEITADEVNLRTAPSTEAEVIATANTGTQLPLLETVTAEDGSNWYKVTYDGTIVYVRSDMAAVVGENQEEEIIEEPTEEEEELTTKETGSEEVEVEEAGTLTFTKKINDLVEITATTEAGVIPEDAELMVNTIEKGTDQYSDTETRLNEKAQNDGYEIAGFLAYDIYFQNSDGEKIEPADGTVKVSISYLQATAPESVQNAEQVEEVNEINAEENDEQEISDGSIAEKTTDGTETTTTSKIAVMHLVEDADGQVQKVVDMTQNGVANIETNENGEVQKAEFETDSFSTFTVAWLNEEIAEYAADNNKLHTVNTIDSTDKGVTMKMVNYSSQQFSGNTWSASVAGRNVKQGILSNTLGRNGYPTFKNGANFADLYKNASSVNHLFLEDVYNSEGYFYYNSGETGASLQENRNFKVFTELTTPEKDKKDEFYYNRGNFLPYNTFEKKVESKNKNLYDSSGNKLASTYSRYDEKLYYPDQNPDYYFAMQLDTKFVQAKNGINNGQAMRYEFTGDDDLWVYIDGVLVLDMGGCHDARSGYIDFSTGEVWVENLGQNVANLSTTLKKQFQKANKGNSVSWNGNIFDDYTAHTMTMFYMERGAGASNLKVKFNLPTIPSKSVTVEKQLSNTDKEKYANVEFEFRLTAQRIQNTDSETNNETYYENSYDIITSNAKLVNADGSDGGTLTFSDNGTFKLKPGQKAVFSGLQENRKYKVEEIGVKSAEYDKVTINGTTVTNQDGNITSGAASVSDRPYILFTNNCSVANQRELRITKKIKNNVEVTDTFNFKVMLNDANGNLIPYVGPYYLQDSNDNYYCYNNSGKLVKTSEGPCGQTSAEGIISGVPAGYTASITQILSGTEFLVQETGIDASKYVTTPEYTLENATLISNNTEGISGTIELNKNALVTVTNELITADLKLLKVDTNNHNVKLQNAVFTLYKNDGDDQPGGMVKENITTDANGQATVTGLTPGKYILRETKAPTTYTLAAKDWMIEVKDNKDINITFNGKNVTANDTGEFPIENTKVYSLPSSGGSGTYGFTISGVAILTAALLLFIKNKRKEDEACRSTH
ncbi:SpaA isopeptide-forming pilin-related protein [Blautia sp. HCP28S3_G10]|uniref:SpaA isopeptide-forming pilin-related protein n=1 Tax=Blautia sp. HCP28S3_G10 TaxID=3438908 RepID=UPI003F8A6E16